MTNLNVRLNEITSRLHSTKSSVVIHRNLETAHARLSQAARKSSHGVRLRELTEESLRKLATSLGLDSWADEPSNGIRTLSITGKIIVVDIGIDTATSEVGTCTLVLATDDGLQEEVTADGRDTLQRELQANELDSFARNLAVLAFLDRNSDPASGLNLFYAQDLLRDALNRKLANRLGLGERPIASASYLNFAIPYYRAAPRGKAQSESKVAFREKQGHVYHARIEIETQPMSAAQTNTDGTKPDESTDDPILYYPKCWVDSSNAWLPTKQFHSSRHRSDLRYVVVFEPAICMPSRLALKLVGDSSSRFDAEPVHLHPSVRKRQVHTPVGPQMINTTVTCSEELLLIRRMAFSHPKELEVILADARQYAICQHVLSTLGDNLVTGTNDDGTQDASTSVIRWRLEMTYTADTVSEIDDRRSIMLAISTEATPEAVVATVLIQPDFNFKCWHAVDEKYFGSALELIEDLPIAMMATASRIPHDAAEKQSEANLAEDSDVKPRMDYRRDPNDAATRNLTGLEAKLGFAYSVPVESTTELATNVVIDPQSPGFLAHLGQALRSAKFNA
ncbi:protein of unknown function [Taphrina deformans PYCC 5710]|uniref:Mediator of RNA polymerase II transcription subunit 1 n=1 Tax=Taphrina deformans (strain PYCC 5710 / ATCC 11124 / CBS 356.35 / IMI 108563 / JCM 9778 / NBRC 8474) TaxID=1097556 RepID=R4X9B1_TAPDE|nr:protein of unknown function [Taphrina deformans PYCC 5710]|eukprot:CCG82010.1 protein of unknown function [Taphrina deformans PYCC 5710]